MVKYREILRQRAMGISIRNIAFSCGCSTATVVTVADRAKARGLEWPLPEEMNDAAIRAAFSTSPSTATSSSAEAEHRADEHGLASPASRDFLFFCKIIASPLGKYIAVCYNI